MLKRAGLMAAGIVVGLVITGVLLEQERRQASGSSDEMDKDAAEKKNGLFAEISGNTVRMYEVKDGHFCGYTDTKVFDSNDEAMEWVARETNAKIIIKEEDM